MEAYHKINIRSNGIIQYKSFFLIYLGTMAMAHNLRQYSGQVTNFSIF